MNANLIKLSKLNFNTGQIEGLPKNPRFIKNTKFGLLVKSLQEDPEMTEIREVVAYDNKGELVIIMGNMRARAAKEIGMTEVPTKILPSNTPIEKLKAYAIKDNISLGSFDWDILANEWDSDELSDWGVDIPIFSEIDTGDKNLYTPNKTPETTYNSVTEEDVNKQAVALAKSQIHEGRNRIDMVCPACGHEYEVSI